jgi:hypothetical protein
VSRGYSDARRVRPPLEALLQPAVGFGYSGGFGAGAGLGLPMAEERWLRTVPMELRSQLLNL